MNDVKLTLIIIAILSVISAVVFFVYMKNRQGKDAELNEYCLKMGYTCNKTKESLLSTLTVESENFVLESFMKALKNPAETSATYETGTKWKSKTQDSRRPVYVIGSIPFDGAWKEAPKSVKERAIQILKAESGFEFDPKQAQVIDVGGKSVFLLFEESPGASYGVVQRLKPLLKEWSKEQVIYIKSSPEEVVLQVHRYFVKDAEMLKKVLALANVI